MIEGHELGSTAISPQWVMVGVELDPDRWPVEWADGKRYLVAGSVELSRAELVNQVRFATYRAPGGIMRRGQAATETTLTCRMDGYTLAFGATYGEALGRLFAGWDPDRPPADPEPEPVALPAGATSHDPGPRHRISVREHLMLHPDHFGHRLPAGVTPAEAHRHDHEAPHRVGIHPHDHVDGLA